MEMAQDHFSEVLKPVYNTSHSSVVTNYVQKHGYRLRVSYITLPISQIIMATQFIY